MVIKMKAGKAYEAAGLALDNEDAAASFHFYLENPCFPFSVDGKISRAHYEERNIFYVIECTIID